MLFHKHLLVNAKVTNPMNTEEQGIEFLKFLVDQIEPNPGLLQFDLYTCGSLDLNKAISILKDYFKVEEMDYVLFDRENGFVVEQSGREANGVFYAKYPNGLEPGLMDPNIGGWFGNKEPNN